MKRKDWECPTCKAIMLKTSELWMCCPFLNYKLFPVFTTKHLPTAIPISKRRFVIKGEGGIWEYVIGAHHRALDEAPQPGEVVARIKGKKSEYARVFKKSKNQKI